ncbi:MAG TPA: hypothetical protein VD902_13130 [Symbiobacteriaceae bacterium]|nr:hypothetical protein [Symbiobacteriaceae bacterium]
MLRGDSHRLYEQLRRTYPTPPAGPLPQMDHVRAIASYYAGLDAGERQLLLAWAKKEESGVGLIPAVLSGVPLLALIFAPFVQQSVKQLASGAWIFLWLVGALAFVAGIYIHYRQKAHATLHVALLERLCQQAPPKT